MTLRPWLELARLSNAPTIVSNVLVGWAMGMRGADEASWGGAMPMTVGVLLLYVGGMALNDIMDQQTDQKERPKQPIPSGRISRTEAEVFAAACVLAGLALIASQGWIAARSGVALVAAIILYNAIHLRTALSVAIMGLCRALVYITSACAFGVPEDWTPLASLAAALAAYVIVFSLMARTEAARPTAGSDPYHWPFRVLPYLPVAALGGVRAAGLWEPSLLTFLAAAAFVLWMLCTGLIWQSRDFRPAHPVAMWIAGISLLDMYHLTRLDQPVAALIAAGCFVLTLLAQRSVPGT